MTRGVSKSGSPTPRLMTSSIVASDVEEAADPGRRDGPDALGEDALGERGARAVEVGSVWLGRIVGQAYGIESARSGSARRGVSRGSSRDAVAASGRGRRLQTVAASRASAVIAS